VTKTSKQLKALLRQGRTQGNGRRNGMWSSEALQKRK